MKIHDQHHDQQLGHVSFAPAQKATHLTETDVCVKNGGASNGETVMLNGNVEDKLSVTVSPKKV